MAAIPCSGVPLSQRDPITTYDSAADYIPVIDGSEPNGKKLKRIDLQYVFSGWTNGDMVLRNNTNGAKVIISARNSSGTIRELARFNPDSESVFFLTCGGNTAAIAASTDGLNVKGNTNILVDTAGGNITIGGIINGATEGQRVNIVKAQSPNTLTINHLKVTGNQKIVTPTGADYVLNNFESIQLIYNPGNDLWYTIGIGK